MSVMMMGAIAGNIAMGSKLGKTGALAGEVLTNAVVYGDAKKNGESGVGAVAQSVAFSVGNAVLGTGPMMAITAAVIAAQVVPEVIKGAAKTAGVRNQAYLGSFGGGFHMTQTAATMREVGMKAIQENGYNLRSALGSEARKYVR